MEEKLKQLAIQFAEQRGITDIIPGGQGGGEPEGEAPGGLLGMMTPKTDDEILAGLIDLPFEKQLMLFEEYPSQRYLIKRLITENNPGEEYLQKWTTVILVWLCDVLGIVATLKENGGEDVSSVIDEGLNIISENQV